MSVTSQFFDHSGRVAPIAIEFRMFLHTLRMIGYDWDQPLSELKIV